MMVTALKWRLMMKKPVYGVKSSSGYKQKPKKKPKLGAKSGRKGKPGSKAIGGGSDSSQKLIRSYFCPEARGISLGSSNTQGSVYTKKYDLSLHANPIVKTDFEKANK